MTPKQRDLLDFIRRYQVCNRGVSPSFTEMQAASGLASKSGVVRLLAALESQGHLSRTPNRARCITLRTTALPHISDEVIAAEFHRRFPSAVVAVPLHGVVR